MKRARIHVYLGTTYLPKRELNDQEIAHDIIEIDIGDNEDVKELELVEQRMPTYRRRMETQEEANNRANFVALEGPSTAASLGVEFTGNTSPVPKMINERVKEEDYTYYRYRLVTLEVPDAITAGEESEGVVEDAEVIDGPP